MQKKSESAIRGEEDRMKRDGRRILFEGISNCRDLGGLQNVEGQYIREGLLLRSAHLRNATPTDVHDLQKYFSLREILDLRDTAEQHELPDAVVPGAVHVDAGIFENVQRGITHEMNLPPYEIWPPMGEIYIKFVTEEPINRNLARAVRRVLVHDYDRGAVLWHCFGGKDRCGMVAALTLSVLGVSYEVIREDYMMTNIEAAARAEEARRKVLERGGPQKEADFEYDANIARESYLDSAFDELIKCYGDAETFLRAAGGVTQEEMDAFKAKILYVHGV